MAASAQEPVVSPEPPEGAAPELPRNAPAQSRRAQREATRERLLNAAVTLLIDAGVARTTTLEVQRRAGVSRGTLLHHFPTHAELLSATVEELVRRNERAVRHTRARLKTVTDPVARAIQTLAYSMAQPSFMAELELWAVARTDTQLREALLTMERDALKEGERVIAELFAPVRECPGYAPVVALSIELLRGLALSSVLRGHPAQRQQRIAQWVWAAQILLDQAWDGDC
jgi:AcrR family transcriptional regulator